MVLVILQRYTRCEKGIRLQTLSIEDTQSCLESWNPMIVDLLPLGIARGMHVVL